MIKEILLITDYKNYFRQELWEYQSMNLDLIEKKFEELGINLTIMSYNTLLNKHGIHKIKNKHIIYTSSQDFRYKSYLDDILFELSKNNTLIPSYEYFKAHENKGYQVIMESKIREQNGIEYLKSFYFGSFEEFEQCKNIISYPIVLKSIQGAGSKKIYKVDSFKSAKGIIIKEYINVLKFIKNIIKKMFFKRKYGTEYDSHLTGGFITQEFVSGLEYDWKILIFYDKFYALKRYVRKKDFRASGSGNFVFEKPNDNLLNFSEKIFRIYDVPCIAFDIAEKNGKYYLIEFQATHFGPTTIKFSSCYYKKINENWKTIERNSIFEIEFVKSICKYLSQKNGIQ